jgi:hypothetical protein
MLVSGCQRNSPWNQFSPPNQKVWAAGAVVDIAADADAAVPRCPFCLRDNRRKPNHPPKPALLSARRNFRRRPRCRCGKFNPLFPPRAPPDRRAPPSAAPSSKSRKSSSHCGRRSNRWKRFWSWSNSPNARNSPTRAKLNHCSARCTGCNHTAGRPNGGSATADFCASLFHGKDDFHVVPVLFVLCRSTTVTSLRRLFF